jgi:hypothetical protein
MTFCFASHHIKILYNQLGSQIVAKEIGVYPDERPRLVLSYDKAID